MQASMEEKQQLVDEQMDLIKDMKAQLRVCGVAQCDVMEILFIKRESKKNEAVWCVVCKNVVF